ncbi:NUDIX hydrolase, core domain protein [Candidatus Magnetobacterium bavaricum]|uniref:GDP-mannose pyrophosphatase n=1 Tax=Candidatus Magnetobacterium bavaricum TaxID=29290 RepID=A0A0F3GJ49_9BACT|nr:NUDIX hydrolase, core domain protein [Candidatus Magnetobacterium bavaricum]
MIPSIVGHKVAWQGRFLNALILEYQTSGGELMNWEAFKRNNCDGIVAIVPFTAEDETIVIKQFRPPIGKYVIEFPAGLNDRNESLVDTARRELLEETGYDAPTLEEITVGPLSAGASTEVLTVYVARDAVCKGTQTLDRGEDIEIIKLPVKDFYQRLYALEDQHTYISIRIGEDETGGHQPYNHSGECYHIRDNLMVYVYEGYHDQCREQDDIKQTMICQSKAIKRKHVKQPVKQLHSRITQGYPLSTVVTPPSENDVTHQRYILPEGNGFVAVGTVRGGADD